MIRRLKAVYNILDFVENNPKASYGICGFLETVSEKEKEETCRELNRMVEGGDAKFEIGGETWEYGCDLENNIDNVNITFRLIKDPNQIQLKILCEIVKELFGQQKGIEDRVDKLVEVEKKAESIAETAMQVETDRKEIEKIESTIESKIKNFEAENKKTGEEIEKKTKQLASNEAEEVVNKMIDEALASRGRIGSSLQDMQKDVLQYMAIFIAVFSLINLNIGGGEKRSLTDFLGINLLVVCSMVTLFSLLSVVLRRPQAEGEKDKAPVWLWVAAILLWIITAVFMCTQCLAG